MRKLYGWCLIGSVTLFWLAPVQASRGSVATDGVVQTRVATTAVIDVAVMVEASCEVATLPIDFGLYLGRDIRVRGDIVVRCTRGVPYNVSLDGGLNVDGTRRQMDDGNGNLVAYDLLTVSGQYWGDDGVTIAAPPVDGVGRGRAVRLKVEGRITGPVEAPTGLYRDLVTVTVNF